MKNFILKRKWGIILAFEITLAIAATYGVVSFFTRYGIQSPVVLRSPLYTKTANIVSPLPKTTSKPSTGPHSMIPKIVPIAEAAPVTDYSGQELKLLVLSYFPVNERNAVDFIVQKESSWNPNAVNSYSGACGLFQSNPCSKMGCDDLSNIQCQVLWGQAYISSRYGNANNAKAHWLAYGNY